jgi:hypothetical protein
MFATTKQARAILRQAFKAANCAVEHTYTEKTTENDPKRRSVVFPCYGDSRKVLEIARDMFIKAGYTSRIPKLTSPEIYYSPDYIRVIAYID